METPICCGKPMNRTIRGKRGTWNYRAFWQCWTCGKETDDFTSDDPEVMERIRTVLPRRSTADPTDRQEDYGFVPDDPPPTSQECEHCIRGKVMENYQWVPCPHCQGGQE